MRVQNHYSSADIADRLDAVGAVNGTETPIAREKLSAINRFLGRGVHAAEELAGPLDRSSLTLSGFGIGPPYAKCTLPDARPASWTRRHHEDLSRPSLAYLNPMFPELAVPLAIDR
jgi:hypothetical protein